ncbi:MAG TPA: sigma-54 dependent transcriptional regulator [Polyangiales bacterium]|nr:sigma-54 dependent transcriptional regulator [Polyangiales bacterium]
MKPRILIVEDERAIQVALESLLRKAGYEVALASGGAEALALAAKEPFDLVITDLALGQGPNGLDVLHAVKATRPETPVVMITARGSEKVAVEAMKGGAEDYVPKPFENEEIRLVVKRALDRTRLEREHRLLLARLEREFGMGPIVGSGPAMQRVFETIAKVADTDLTVLVRGESGTGKELVAQALHQRGERKTRPLVAVNCAAINRELVESELFGHERGAFTGANNRRVGRFESAHQGTIFLDEIGDMPIETQAKVLRVLEERKFERVGGGQSVEVDVRVVAATHRDLEGEVRRGNFRQDLFYRLKVVEIVLPPLRERLPDLPSLVERFLTRIAERLGREKKGIEGEALALLARHDWPGNVRELRNVIEQAAVLAEGPLIRRQDLPTLSAASPPAAAAASGGGQNFAEAKRRSIEDFERGYIQAALRDSGGNVSRAAQAMGLARQSLQQKIRDLGLRSSDDEADA